MNNVHVQCSSKRVNRQKGLYLLELGGDVPAIVVQQRPAHDVGQVGLMRVDQVVQGASGVQPLLQRSPRGLQHLEHHVVAANTNTGVERA